MIQLSVLYYIYLNAYPQVDALFVNRPACAKISHYIKHEAAVKGIDPLLAAKIAIVESNCRVKAVNKRTADFGLFQINASHKVPKDCLFDARCNTRVAMTILEWSLKKSRLCAYNLGNKVAKNKKTCYAYEYKVLNVK